jgi:hypothetical protein
VSEKIQCHFQGAIDFGEFGGRECADVLGQIGPSKAEQIITTDPRLMLHTLRRVDHDLRSQSRTNDESRRTNQGRKSLIDQRLTAYDYKQTIFLGIAARLMHTI